MTGVEKHDFTHQSKSAKTTGHVATGIGYQPVASTYVEFTPYIKHHANDEVGYGALFRLENKF
ncbi:MAG: hypothetical protein Q4B79_08035 [Moraxella sp.]|uniref:hypothetical protein n=1 Tax=Moraxella sp. TaxID=479 RepID=UPI0026DACE95|nr:hypothetical protein [Moraxella sp.]MDO4450889.1 hypothetical protein [Moraxella sp.]